MTAQKPETSGARPSKAPAAGSTGRKPWKKRTAVEVVLDQVAKLRDQVATKEAEINEDKRQLKKLEEAVKLLEGA